MWFLSSTQQNHAKNISKITPTLQTSTTFAVFPPTQQPTFRIQKSSPRAWQTYMPNYKTTLKKILHPLIDAGASRGSSQGRTLRACRPSMTPQGDLSAPAFLAPLFSGSERSDVLVLDCNAEVVFFLLRTVILDLRMNGNGVVGTSLICRRLSFGTGLDTYPALHKDGRRLGDFQWCWIKDWQLNR